MLLTTALRGQRRVDRCECLDNVVYTGRPELHSENCLNTAIQPLWTTDNKYPNQKQTKYILTWCWSPTAKDNTYSDYKISRTGSATFSLVASFHSHRGAVLSAGGEETKGLIQCLIWMLKYWPSRQDVLTEGKRPARPLEGNQLLSDCIWSQFHKKEFMPDYCKSGEKPESGTHRS